ncbi:hypothetical protein BDN67DRAFT_962867 [Paxillus ammoniavirescens]|nr:hypothetical protein BDN67DRAFT_962867 [Paxillus ammoniavirescens]
MASGPSQVQPTRSAGPDPIIHCNHGEQAVKRTSSTGSTANLKHLREFYCCKRPRGDPTRCDFWHWADGPLLKQTIAPVSTSQTETPRSAKRLEDINAGLRQRKLTQSQSPSRAGPSKQHVEPISGPPLPTFSAKDAPTRPASPAVTEVDHESDVPPKNFSFLGLEYTPEVKTSTIEDPEGHPTTPKKPRLIPSTEEILPAAGAASAGASLLLTPPETTRPATHRQPGERKQETRPQPVTPTKRKGKGKELEYAQVGQIERKGRHLHRTGSPVKTSRPALENDALPLFTHSRGSSTSSNESPTTADNVVDYVDGVKARINALTEYMDSFDVTQAARYLQTVERQKLQYEQRDQSQRARIEELVAEREGLVAEVSRLKESLRLSEEDNRAKDAEIAALKARRPL